jgi:hypothetical protein
MRGWPFALGVALVVALAAPNARGDEPTAVDARKREAAERFDRALALVRDDRLADALDEFRAAYDLVPSYQVLYNVAQVEFRLGDDVAALATFRRYLHDGGDAISPAQRDEVARFESTLLARVARLRITTREPATLTLDGAVIGVSPLPGPVLLNPGRHTLAAARDGYETARRVIDAPAGREEAVMLDPAPLAPAPTAEPSPRAAPRHMSTLSWVGVGAAGALAAGGAVTGVLALQRANDLTDAPPAAGDAASERTHVKTLATVSDVLIGAAAVTLGVTLVLTFAVHGDDVALRAGPGYAEARVRF